MIFPCRWMDENSQQAVCDYLLEGKLTTYLVTKALGEVIVSEGHGHLPTSIVRPCNISPTIRDPFPVRTSHFVKRTKTGASLRQTIVFGFNLLKSLNCWCPKVETCSKYTTFPYCYKWNILLFQLSSYFLIFLSKWKNSSTHVVFQK